MAKIKRLIPFWMWPGSWGLKGTAYQEAEAYYYYEGEDLERRLAEIRHADDEKGLAKALAHLDYRYGRLSQYEYDLKVLHLDNGTPKDALDLELVHGKISPYEYDIAVAKLQLSGDDLRRRLIEIDFEHGKINAYVRDYGLAEINHPAGPERDLAIAKISLKHNIIDQYAYDRTVARLTVQGHPDQEIALLRVDHAHGKISTYDLDRKIAELETEEGVERELALLEVEYLHKRISKHEYEKQKATLEDQPWVGIIDQHFDPEQGPTGISFEFDWNQQWIDFLRLSGYSGMSENEIVEAWFNDLCREVVTQQWEDNAHPDDIVFRNMIMDMSDRANRARN